VTFARFESSISGNIRVHVCSSSKFKTTTLAALIQRPLSPETVTRSALLPSVLQRGTASYPQTLAFRRKLDELYGATLFGDVAKRGGRHVMQFGMEIANGLYLKENPNLLDEGLRFLSEVLLSPVAENGVFHADYVEAEKKNLKQKILSLQDDKIRYAAHRMMEEMFRGEPVALFNHGRSEDLDTIDPANLYTYYQEVIQQSPIDFYCVGDVSAHEVAEKIHEHFQPIFQSSERLEISSAYQPREVEKEQVVVDRLDVKQGKLNIGCRANVTLRDPDYPALLMYNGILGGFPHSKLFRNVREKESLAYYCSSRLESHLGCLMIQSGIEIGHYDKAVNIIKEQLEAMRQGEISDNELNQTKAMLSNQLREQQDRSWDMILFHYQSVLSGRERTLEDLLAKLNAVTKEDVERVANRVQVDTIYFLRDKGGDIDAKN